MLLTRTPGVQVRAESAPSCASPLSVCRHIPQHTALCASSPVVTSRGSCSASRGQSAVLRAAATSPPSVGSLQSKFGKKDHVEITSGKGGLPMVVLKTPSGSKAEVYLWGATITSFTQPSGDDVLYVRPDAKFDKSKGISGGIPHCFPQFGPGPIQQHGFARQCDWEITSTSADPNPDDIEPSVELQLTDNEYTRKIWPHSFKAVYSVSLHGEKLRTDFRVFNTCSKEFEFTAALHSYFEVTDVSKAKVNNLQNLKYLDKTADMNNPADRFLKSESLTFEGPWDAIFVNPPEHIELDVGTGAAVAIDAQGWDNAVVWNPWTAAGDCYKKFVCVENAKITKPVHLKPSESWRGEQEISIVDLV